MTEISGLVVHYGSLDLLEACLGALVPQVDHTVVVNNSCDLVPTALKAAHGVAVTWDEPGRNLGFSRGVNRALYRLRHEFVLVANPDTTLYPGAARALADYLRRNPRLAMAGPRLLNPCGDLQTSSYRLPTLIQLAGYLLGVAGRVPPRLKGVLARTSLVRSFGQLDPHLVEKEVEMISGACFMMRRRALADAGPFDPGFFLYYEEKDLCRRLWDSGWAVGFTPTAVAEHLIGGSAPPRTARAHRHRAFGALRYFQRHGTHGQRVGARAFLLAYSLVSMARAADREEHAQVVAACLARRMPCGSC